MFHYLFQINVHIISKWDCGKVGSHVCQSISIQTMSKSKYFILDYLDLPLVHPRMDLKLVNYQND